MAYVAAGLQTGLITIGLAVLVSACTDAPQRDHTQPSKEPYALSREHVTMGSTLQVTLWTANDPAAMQAFDAVFAEFDRLDRLMSVWKEGSDVQRLNMAAGDHPVPVSADTL